MKLLNIEEIDNGINSRSEISSISQEHLRIGNYRYITDFAHELELSFNILIISNTEVVSLATIITNYFFVKESYLNYDRQVDILLTVAHSKHMLILGL